MSIHWGQRALAVFVGGLAMVAVLASPAYAAQPDYQGTYVGAGTSASGKSLPITVILRDDGETVTITMSARGYTVKATSPEVWVDDTTLKVTPVISGAFSRVLSGSGEATFVLKDKKWTASGSGTGTLLAMHSGSATGSMQMLTRSFDLMRADEWHKANPLPGTTKTRVKTTPATVKTVQSVSAPLAPERQLPISEPEKLATTAFILLFFFVEVFLSLILGHQPLPAEVVGAMPSQGGDSPTAEPPSVDVGKPAGSVD